MATFTDDVKRDDVTRWYSRRGSPLADKAFRKSDKPKNCKLPAVGIVVRLDNLRSIKAIKTGYQGFPYPSRETEGLITSLAIR